MDFYKRAAIVCARIPEGKTASYGQIALLCGAPSHARQVGYGLRQGLLGPEVPAHRVVNAAGVLSGAASFETYDMQKLLLEGEGVEVSPREGAGPGWQVDRERWGWRPSMKEAEELRALFEQMGI